MRALKQISIFLMFFALLAGCAENLADRTAREAKEYTRRNCPTPPQNYLILDSITFDKSATVLARHYRITGIADRPEQVASKKAELREALINSIINDTSLEKLKQAGYSFAYIYRSDSHRETILFQDTIVEADYTKNDLPVDSVFHVFGSLRCQCGSLHEVRNVISQHHHAENYRTGKSFF